MAGGSASSQAFAPVNCSKNKKTGIYSISLFPERQNLSYLLLEASSANATLSTNPPVEISPVRHRAGTKITPGARCILETRPSQRSLLPLQRLSSQQDRVCRTGKREFADQAQRIDVCFSVSIKDKSPANVRFSDLGRGFRSIIRPQFKKSRTKNPLLASLAEASSGIILEGVARTRS